MKKLLFLFAFVIGLTISLKAQQARLYPLSTSDTLNNHDTTVYDLKATAGYEVASFQLNLAKITGTVAGTYVFAGSIDGTNYKTLSNDTLTTASQYYWYSGASPAYVNYRVTVITTGTSKVMPKLYYVFRRYD